MVNFTPRLRSIGEFQQLSRLGFVTAPKLLNGGHPNFARCLAVSWAGTLYIHFWGCCPLTEFCRAQSPLCVQGPLCVQVLRSMLATLLHGIRAVRVSQSLRRGTRKFRRVAITWYFRATQLWPPYAITFLSCGFFFFYLLLFLAYSQPLQIRCLSYFYTWCGLSANLGCKSETCCMQLAENTGRKKSSKIRHLGAIAQICRAISLQLRHVSTIGKKLVKQQCLRYMSSQCGELLPTSD